MGVWKCCLPWCGPAEGKAAPPSSPPIPQSTDCQPRARQPSPHLQDIAEESDPEDNGADPTNSFNDSSLSTTTIYPLTSRVSYKKRRSNVQSPSPTLSIKTSRKSQRTRSITSTTSSDSSTPAIATASAVVPTKMQAEQGSIGDLQRYHNRYLRNRRHTLANVR